MQFCCVHFSDIALQNVLIERQTLQDTAKEFGIEEKKVCDILVDGKAKLWKARKLRPKPHRDDKIITSWNGTSEHQFSFE